MAEGIPIDQANSLTLKIQELEQKVQVLTAQLTASKIKAAEAERRVERHQEARDAADEVHGNIIDKLLTRLEDR